MNCSGEEGRQTACKPGSVPPDGGDGHSSGTLVAERLVRPTRAAARRLARHLRILPECLPLLLGLAPGGVFPAAAVAGGAVRSYRTLSPLPLRRSRKAGSGRARRFAFCGTVPGVAPAGRYPAPCFRGARTFLPPPGEERRAAIRPSGLLKLGRQCGSVNEMPLPSAGTQEPAARLGIEHDRLPFCERGRTLEPRRPTWPLAF